MMEFRKLQKTGDGTFFVTLPKTWIRKLGAEQGATLLLEERSDGRLLIGQHGHAERKLQVKRLDVSPTLGREIGEQYLLGYDIIEIESKRTIPQEIRDGVKRALKRLSGLEIIDESPNRLSIQCLIEPSVLVPDKILRRMHAIAVGMERDAILSISKLDASKAQSVAEQDEEVDKLYFLLVRLLRAALTDPLVAERVVVSPIDCLDFRLLGAFLETFADYAVMISKKAPSVGGRIVTPGLRKHIDSIGNEINQIHVDAFNAVISRNLKLAGEVVARCSQAKEKTGEAEKALAGSPKPVAHALTSVMLALDRMIEINTDIADLTVTR